MRFHCLTLFPEIIKAATCCSILKRAQNAGYIEINCVNIRDFAANKHKQTDDYPYGGGAGMVMTPQPIYDAYLSIINSLPAPARVVYLTPQGKTFNQRMAAEFSKQRDLILLCGHYEGIDERVTDEIVNEEVSLGDFILTGGELGAAVIIDAVSRLVPGVLSSGALSNESFNNNLLEYPQYTRPQSFLGREVPQVLLSGNHGEIEKWRQEQALKRTASKRPDLTRLK